MIQHADYPPCIPAFSTDENVNALPLWRENESWAIVLVCVLCARLCVGVLAFVHVLVWCVCVWVCACVCPGVSVFQQVAVSFPPVHRAPIPRWSPTATALQGVAVTTTNVLMVGEKHTRTQAHTLTLTCTRWML